MMSDVPDTAPLPVCVLGVAPAVNGAPAWAADAGSGRSLAKLAGVEPAQLPEVFGLDNLCPTVMPSTRVLREHGLAYVFVPGWRYLLAGWDVRQALGTRARPALGRTCFYTPPELEWFVSREGVEVALLPHPSGRNRWYNSAANRERARLFLRSVAAKGGAQRAFRAAKGLELRKARA